MAAISSCDIPVQCFAGSRKAVGAMAFVWRGSLPDEAWHRVPIVDNLHASHGDAIHKNLCASRPGVFSHINAANSE
jgi:hypothetical protein